MEEKNDFGVKTYETKGKSNNMTGFLFIIGALLLILGFGYQNFIMGIVGIMCVVLGALKRIKKKVEVT